MLLRALNGGLKMANGALEPIQLDDDLRQEDLRRRRERRELRSCCLTLCDGESPKAVGAWAMSQQDICALTSKGT